MEETNHAGEQTETALIVDEALTQQEMEPGKAIVSAGEEDWEEFSDAASMRSRIFAIPDIQEEVIKIPEWRMSILVRGLSGKMRARLLQANMKADGSPNLERMYPDLVIATSRHPLTHDLIFSPADREALNEKSGGVLERLALAAARLSGLDTASQQEAMRNFQKS